jgi:hypothetical protein
MNWLKDYLCLTGGLALPFAMWSAITKLREKDGQPLDFTWGPGIAQTQLAENWNTVNAMDTRQTP